MKQKMEIIKTIDITDNLVVIIAKKINTEPKFCKDCPHFKYFEELSVYYCDKYKGIVCETDRCIEDGM